MALRYTLARYLDTLIKQWLYIVTNSYIKNTYDFIKKMDKFKLDRGYNIMISLDVKNIYTSIPTLVELKFLKNKLTLSNKFSVNEIHSIN